MSLPPTTEPHKDFIRRLDRMEGPGFSRRDALCLFLDQAFRACRGPTLRGDEWQANEDEYLATVAKLREPAETMWLAAECLAIATQAIEGTFDDFLGPIVEECGTSAQAGQFFTPYPVALMTAEMTVADVVVPDDRPLEIQEPAAGCGAMVLACAKALAARGVDPSRTHYTLIDVDHRLVQAAFIQTTLAGVPATVFHANALTLETWGSYRNAPRLLQVVGLPLLAVERARAVVDEVVSPATAPPVPAADVRLRQPDLFGGVTP